MKSAPPPTIPAILAAAVAGVVLGLHPTPAAARQLQTFVPLGPLRTAEQNPLYRLYYVPDADGADPIAHGTARFELSGSYSNIFENSASRGHRQLFDMEQLATSLTARWGATPSVELGARADLYTAWGGFLDPFISGLHALLSVSNEGRQSQPEGQYRFLLAHHDEEALLDVPGRTLDLEEIRAFAKWRVAGGPDDSFAVSVKGTVRHYVGSVDPGRTDAAAAVLGRRSRGRTHLHALIGGTTLTAPEGLVELTPDAALFFALGAEYGLTEGLAAAIEVVSGARYVSGFPSGDLNRIPLSVAFGFSGATASGWAWQASFAEDIPPRTPSVDFTIDLEIARTVGGG